MQSNLKSARAEKLADVVYMLHQETKNWKQLSGIGKMILIIKVIKAVLLTFIVAPREFLKQLKYR